VPDPSKVEGFTPINSKPLPLHDNPNAEEKSVTGTGDKQIHKSGKGCNNLVSCTPAIVPTLASLCYNCLGPLEMFHSEGHFLAVFLKQPKREQEQAINNMLNQVERKQAGTRQALLPRAARADGVS